MGGWLKLFTDGSKELGNDEAIIKKMASWSLGRQDNIKEVRLFYNQRVCSLTVPNTSWYQFDRFSVLVAEGTPKSVRTHRVIQAQICSNHVGQSIICSRTGGHYSWTVIRDLLNTDADSSFCYHKLINRSHVEKWLTVVLPDKDYPGMTFTTKGKMYDNQYLSR